MKARKVDGVAADQQAAAPATPVPAHSRYPSSAASHLSCSAPTYRLRLAEVSVIYHESDIQDYFLCHVDEVLATPVSWMHLHKRTSSRNGAAGSTAGATGASVSRQSAPLAQLEIPDSEVVTPEGSAGAQQVSPLLMSIKKLVSQQAAVESEHSLAITPGSENSNAGMRGSRSTYLAQP